MVRLNECVAPLTSTKRKGGKERGRTELGRNRGKEEVRDEKKKIGKEAIEKV